MSVGVGFVAGRAGAGTGTAPGEGSRAEARVRIVRAGDTLWNIAVNLAGTGQDPRPLVDDLIELNDLHDALIVPGQRLKLP